MGRCLISVAMNRRHLAEGQKAVLANEYMKGLSKKRESEAGKKAINARWHPDKEYVSEIVSETYNEKVKNDARKIASERWKVSEWNVRIAQEIEKKAINVRWHPEKKYDEETVSPSYEEQERSRKIASERWKVSEWKVLTNFGDCLQEW